MSGRQISFVHQLTQQSENMYLVNLLCLMSVCVTLERMKRSLLGLRGSSGRYFMV